MSRGSRRRATFAQALAAEWLKFFTVRSAFWGLLATVVVTVGLSALLALAFVVSLDQLPASRRAAFDPGAYGLAGLNFGVITLGVLGVLTMSGEYSTGSIKSTLAAVPRRGRLLAAKLVVLAVVSLITGLLVSFASFFASQAVFATRGLAATLGQPGLLRAVLGGGLYLALVALFSLGLATIVRHTAGAITAVLGLLFVLPIFGAFLPGEWGATTQKFLPSTAGAAIMNAAETSGSLAPWTGFGVFAGYTAIILAIALWAFRRRDA
ncbi:ABC transporter permease subunit [Acrocarpospora macrocephala]|uniref:ABC transporter permease n=1 Tax=Acrocarpospora macrocephala TaxID=150177 RepID=A0A5M3WN84_9ACTN|nr:ABC transporter permease subunit [Acrocarpospora macrocephala]GES10745.1 ABC transporter permease [Acrocarpospora macrocephala]